MPARVDIILAGAAVTMFAALAHAQNLLVNPSFEDPVVASFEFLPNGDVPGWDAYVGTTCGGPEGSVEFWDALTGVDPRDADQHLEISASTPNAVVCQTVAGLTNDCPATLCFYYTGRPGSQDGVPFDNTFTLTLSGGASYSTTLSHVPYVAPPATGWQRFCTTFTPTTSPMTVAFSREPVTGDQGGAHIDGVSLIQPLDCQPACGNGDIDLAEECDDGNVVDEDGCDSNCLPTGCGNGVLTSGESCDDGNVLNGDGCDFACEFECGNGMVVAPETCDPPGSPAGGGGIPCRADCTVCGDQVVQAVDGEQCDDGNAADDDGCDSACLLECGNGGPDPGELCDDGNFVDGDGCDTNCTATACGNDIQAGSEECDDGNTASEDGCDGTCALEPCGPAPDPLCKHSTQSFKSTLKLRDDPLEQTKDQMIWRWTKGADTDPTELGDPLTADDYWFCLYDGDALRSSTRIPFGGTCDGAPCWKQTGTGFRFRNKTGSVDGATRLKLVSGDPGKARIVFKAKGVDVDMPSLSPLTGPLTAQIVNVNASSCWAATFPAPFLRDDGEKLIDKGD